MRGEAGNGFVFCGFHATYAENKPTLADVWFMGHVDLRAE